MRGNGGTFRLPFHFGVTGVEVRFHNIIIGNFMVYQDRLELNLLQLFAHAENSEWFSILSVITYVVNIVAEQSNIKHNW